METPYKYFDIVNVNEFNVLKEEGILLLEATWLNDGRLGVSYVPSDLVEEYMSQQLQDQAQLGIAENLLHKVNSQLKNGTFKVVGDGKTYILDTLSMVRMFNINRYKTIMNGVTFLANGVEHVAALI